MANEVEYYTEEARQRIFRPVRDAGASVATGIMRLLTGGGAGYVATHFGLGSLLLGGGSLALAGFLRGAINRQEHRQQEKRLILLYRNEIAALNGIDPTAVTPEDLHRAADINPGLREAVQDNDKRRTFNTAVWTIAATAAYAATVALIALVPAFAAAGIIGSFIFSYAAFSLVHKVAETVGERALKLDQPNVADYVYDLTQKRNLGQTISREQVMEVYIAAQPRFGEQIAQAFGNTPFNKMTPEMQRRAVIQFGNAVNLQEVTDAINSDQINARELLFLPYGQRSGAENEGTLIARAKLAAQERVLAMRQQVGQWRDTAQNRWQQWRGQSHAQDPEAALAGNPGPLQTKWLEATGRSNGPNVTDASWQEREKSRRSPIPGGINLT